MVWSGRNLTALTRDMLYHTLSFDYNADGVRIKKSNSDYVDEQWVNDTYNYVLDGSKIIKETIEHKVNSTITGTDVLYYYYDESGVAGFELNGTVYYYLKNIQGDVINILNSSGQVVVTYTYDAWGKVLSVTGSLASTVGQINPFRYRGYYYDTETGWYYLQTRYYDPEVGRFSNADGIIGANGGIIGLNSFAYCSNNPVGFSDPSGEQYVMAEADKYLSTLSASALALMKQFYAQGVFCGDARYLAAQVDFLRTKKTDSRTIIVAYDSGSPTFVEIGQDKSKIDYSATLFVVNGYSIVDAFSGETTPQFPNIIVDQDSCYAIVSNGIYDCRYDSRFKEAHYLVRNYNGGDSNVPCMRWSIQTGKYYSSEARGIYIHKGGTNSYLNHNGRPSIWSKGCILVNGPSGDYSRFVNLIGCDENTTFTFILYGRNRY